jgi:hypothetical protein
MSAVATPLQTIQSLLVLQGQVGRPTAPICSAIAAMKDLCELQGSQQVDWRRGAAGGGTGSPRGGGSGRPAFRSMGDRGGGSSTSLSSMGGGGSTPTPISMNRVSSRGSLGTPSPTSPSGGAGGSGTPFTPSGVTGGPVRYQSKLRNSSAAVEDKILNNIILSKLNKFSGSTYNDIRDFLYQILGSGEPDLVEMIRHFMLLVFKKAACEETYCPLYAKLLAEISDRYKVILEEMHKLQANYLHIFDDVEEPPEGGVDYDAFVAKNKEKQYRQGYSQFMAELATLEILDRSNLEQTFRRLFELLERYGVVPDKKALLEDYTDCLARMSRVLAKKSSPFFREARAAVWQISKEPLERLIAQKEKYPSLSVKARFILMDVKDYLKDD